MSVYVCNSQYEGVYVVDIDDGEPFEGFIIIIVVCSRTNTLKHTQYTHKTIAVVP